MLNSNLCIAESINIYGVRKNGALHFKIMGKKLLIIVFKKAQNCKVSLLLQFIQNKIIKLIKKCLNFITNNFF